MRRTSAARGDHSAVRRFARRPGGHPEALDHDPHQEQGRPWSVGGFGSSFIRAKVAAGLADSNLHFHDLCGTAATRHYVAGLKERVIAEIMGWEEEHVAGIIRRYVGRAAATKAIIRQLNDRRT